MKHENTPASGIPDTTPPFAPLLTDEVARAIDADNTRRGPTRRALLAVGTRPSAFLVNMFLTGNEEQLDALAELMGCAESLIEARKAELDILETCLARLTMAGIAAAEHLESGEANHVEN